MTASGPSIASGPVSGPSTVARGAEVRADTDVDFATVLVETTAVEAATSPRSRSETASPEPTQVEPTAEDALREDQPSLPGDTSVLTTAQTLSIAVAVALGTQPADTNPDAETKVAAAATDDLGSLRPLTETPGPIPDEAVGAAPAGSITETSEPTTETAGLFNKAADPIPASAEGGVTDRVETPQDRAEAFASGPTVSAAIDSSVETQTLAASTVSTAPTTPTVPVSAAPRPTPSLEEDAATRATDTDTEAATNATEIDAATDASVDAPMASGVTPRTRDAIDRAQVLRADAAAEVSPGDTEIDTETKAGTEATASAQTSASTAASSDRPPAASAAILPAQASAPTEPETPALQAAQAAVVEAQRTETTASLSLSMTSQASVETTAHIAAQIVRKLEARSTRFEMALTPEDLGRVDVSLDIDSDGQLAARLAFDNPVAATELRGRVDELRRQLQDAGFTVTDDALSFSQRDPSNGQGGAFDRGSDPRGSRAFGAAARLTSDTGLAAAADSWISLNLTRERVDMKV